MAVNKPETLRELEQWHLNEGARCGVMLRNLRHWPRMKTTPHDERLEDLKKEHAFHQHAAALLREAMKTTEEKSNG